MGQHRHLFNVSIREWLIFAMILMIYANNVDNTANMADAYGHVNDWVCASSSSPSGGRGQESRGVSNKHDT